MSADVHPANGISETPRCFACFRPAKLCYCCSIPTVDNRTDVWIVQHRRERFHPFNTARIVHQGLRRCRLMVDHNLALARQFHSERLSPKVGLLYPGEHAKGLTDLPADQLPDQLVVIDGTWHHAKSLLRDIPRLRTLPQYNLNPTVPGRYRIRREPNEYSLSTIEATVAALQSIEPETAGLDALLRVFERMVDDQICQTDHSNWRHNRRRQPGSSNLPKALRGDLANIVVAYGEQEPGADTRFKRSDARRPIYWVAKRLGTGERFSCAIQPRFALEDDMLEHLRLAREEFRSAVSIESFRERWASFLRPDDQVAVYHPSTARMLGGIDGALRPSIVLKAINSSPRQSGGTLDNLLNEQAIQPSPTDGSRAEARLANAIALIRHLHENVSS